MNNVNPTKTQAWKKLQAHYSEIKGLDLKEAFQKDQNRADAFTLQWEDLYVDYSKNLITEETRDLLTALAEEAGLKQATNALFEGEEINRTEGRSVLHTALRSKEDTEVKVDGENVMPEVFEVKNKIKSFCYSVISGAKKGYSGEAFTDVVNIGIGGSDLGPVMVTEALEYYKNHLKVHFVSNVDGDHVQEVIKDLNPETTLFVIVSKSFSTQETLANSTTIRKWFTKKAPADAVAKHFVAVSSNVKAVEEFGIESDNIFPMWDWVGGRFSLWSAVGLSISLSIGYDNFNSLLEGARKMDEHFKGTPFKENIPVQLALLTIWYNNFFEAETQAVIPYTQYLHRFPAYLQQAIMESNGKGVDRDGNEVSYQTGNVVWGEPGTNSQHAFFQLIHQGTKLIPADFIGFRKSLHKEKEHHDKLMANFFAQTEALLQGKTSEEVRKELEAKNLSEEQVNKLLPFKVFKGNNPTTTLLIDQLSPESLGKLVALYEHQIFVQGIIWNIYSYDQWGVELGKELATKILTEIEKNDVGSHDSSTENLLKFYLQQ
ncbi:glucose-6-phosphate isomerase [Salinimicrobium sp. TH3]|uniref:glucose-6-phosphate isomerase n=1 Tax=Salinimicrobium sp. TH3 TaxID=2997342 RepID=UPI002272EB12|nr:glucose-6-phosphate isomerase [Salinimicrobium sp. TH3]MCY2686343.1 glucose-6-phosphate isomerase [Salinimicrobium sp. TH3]